MLSQFPDTFGNEALPSLLQGLADQRGQSLERGTGGDRQFRLRPAHYAAGTTQGSACLRKRGVVHCQDVPTEQAEMDEVEASLRKEGREHIIEFLREKCDLCERVSMSQRVGRFHHECVLVD